MSDGKLIKLVFLNKFYSLTISIFRINNGCELRSKFQMWFLLGGKASILRLINFFNI